MLINVSKAVEGEFYPIDGKVKIDKSLLRGRQEILGGECDVKGTYVLINGDCVVDAKCEVKLLAECDLCLTAVELNYTFRMAEGYSLEKYKEGFNYQYEGNEVNLIPAISENFVMNLPTRVLCDKNCKGLCQRCGADLNKAECKCDLAQQQAETNNPFAILKEMKIAGGAKNGSTKKKNI